MKIRFFFLLLFSLCVGISQTSSYFFGLKSADNTIENIQTIESTYQTSLPLVGFIFDPWVEKEVMGTLDRLGNELGNERIYHITISPNMFSAEEVANGAFDMQYKMFFKKIKEKNLKVIFRTMHEMNGGRYPRSSNPETFKKAWIHVWTLSRTVGLTPEDILFDFSLNHWDMPTTGKPSQQASLIRCNPYSFEKSDQGKGEWKDSEKKCYHFEEYYPGDAYVDIMGVTFYNRGKASDDRLRLTPSGILNDPERQTLSRIKSFNKPVFVDEVATTAVFYPGEYSHEKSREDYLLHSERKDERILQLKDFLESEGILGALYFNTDFTDGLKYEIIGEADRAMVNLTNGKIYPSFYAIQRSAQSDLTPFYSMFGKSKKLQIGSTSLVIPSKIEKEVSTISMILESKFKDPLKRSEMFEKLKQLNIKDTKIKRALEILDNVY